MSIEALIEDARERLVARAKKEGLATVGYDRLSSPLGPLWVAITERGVATIHYGPEPSAAELRRLVRVYGPGIVPDARRSAPLARELEQYFAGRRTAFDLDVDLAGLTAFQRRVLEATKRVPFGSVTTYRTIADRAGNERASRAAGAALGANPVPIIVPCHRIVASDGSLGGYAGGLEAKRALLAIERGDAVPAGGWPPARRALTER